MRKGYYKKGLVTDPDKEVFESVIYVIETDRFTNGESQIEIDKIDVGIAESKVSSDKIRNFIRTSFVSVVKSSDIVWLESEQDIKEARKNKLNQLKVVIEKGN